MIDYLIELDKQLFLGLNSLHNSFFDFIMWHISGKYTFIPFYVFLLYLLIKQEKKRVFISIILIGLLIFAADQISVHFFKNVFERLRPSHTPVIKDIVHIVNDKRGGQFGFVSSHAANVFALATFTSFVLHKNYIRILLFIWAIIVSYSRVYLGVHFPADILGGAFLGMFLGICFYYIYFIINNKLKVLR